MIVITITTMLAINPIKASLLFLLHPFFIDIIPIFTFLILLSN